MKRPVDLGRNISRAESGTQALVGLFGRSPRETKELVAIRSGVTPKTFLNVRGYRFRGVTELCGIWQKSTLEQQVDVIDYRSRAVEYS